MNTALTENNLAQPSQRIVWIDWMKVMATLAIIWLHFFSTGGVLSLVFSVQTFCIISGFLYKESANWKTLIWNSFWQLFVPTIIFSFIIHLDIYIRCLVNSEDFQMSWLYFLWCLLLGEHWCMGPSWYFCSLIVMRFVMQALPEKKWVHLLLLAACVLAALILKRQERESGNAYICSLLCMPFFIIGFYMRPMKQRLSNLHNYQMEFLLFLMSVGCVIACGYYNGEVYMYLAQYGNSYSLYLIGGISGCSMLYIVSLWLSRMKYRNMMRTLANGTIMIIGLHIIFVRRLTELPDRFWVENVVLAFLVLLVFVPLIKLAEKFCPLLTGHYKSVKKLKGKFS